MNQGLLVMDKLKKIGLPEVERMVKDVANLYVGSTAGISCAVSESNVTKKSNAVLPPVVPHQLVIFPHLEFFCVVHTQLERPLAAGWSLPAIDYMEQDHQYLVRSTDADLDLHYALAACNDVMSFDDSWSIVKGWFESLCPFIGGIASVFPDTAQVESDC